jgi:PAS domain S-box-containing protein
MTDFDRKLHAVLDATPFPVAVVDLQDDRIFFWSRSALTLFGHTAPTASEWYQMAYPDLDYRRDVIARWKPSLEMARHQSPRAVKAGEYRITCRDGSERICELYAAFIGEYLIVTFSDITDRKKAESIARESEERFRSVANTAPVMIWMSNVDKLCNFFNQSWLEFTGRSIEQEIGNGWAESVHSEDLERCLDIYTKAFDRRERFHMEYRLRRRDGEYRWILDNGVPMYKADGSFAGYIGSCIDITERKLAEEILSTFSRRLIDAQEEERSRIARELHDDINQRLAMLALNLDDLKDHLPASAAKLRREVGKARKKVRDLGTDIRALSHGLHSFTLDHFGLAAAARGFCKEFADRQGVEVECHFEHLPKALPREVSLCLFRVLQEALQNATKHSGSRHVRVSLRGGASGIDLKVHDSGIGFEPDQAIKGHGLGLISIKERLKVVHGELLIDSQIRRGTTIHARVPLNLEIRSAGARD